MKGRSQWITFRFQVKKPFDSHKVKDFTFTQTAEKPTKRKENKKNGEMKVKERRLVKIAAGFHIATCVRSHFVKLREK
ncbi:TPA: hypothetical protein I7705_19805 [Vibrio vulnificus]|nr:hypothetical protein [Vibrio vulnificus]HAS8308220.1 hypothetical protein [Vibrio vulnificus]